MFQEVLKLHEEGLEVQEVLMFQEVLEPQEVLKFQGMLVLQEVETQLLEPLDLISSKMTEGIFRGL